jgi:hypothetical protein
VVEKTNAARKNEPLETLYVIELVVRAGNALPCGDIGETSRFQHAAKAGGQKGAFTLQYLLDGWGIVRHLCLCHATLFII